MMRTLRRSLALICLVALASCIGLTAALAHATYKSSNPADESTVTSAPSQITAEFTEPMSSGSYMDVTDPCGRDTGSGSSQTGSSMSVQNSGTAAGTYSVFWRAVSIDGHTTEGTFTFTVASGDPCPGEEEPPDDGGGKGEGSSDGGGSGGGSAAAGSTDSTATASESSGGHDRHSDGRGRERGRARQGAGKGKGGSDSSADTNDTGTLAGGAQTDVPDAPSALEGIPLDGLLITLGVAALIGAAAGKIYVSLSGDE